MVLEPITKEKIKIRLSNTESVGQNIYKYTSLSKKKETKSKSSTCNYFLTTNASLAKELGRILNDPCAKYYLDVNKVKKCLNEEVTIIEREDLAKNFKGSLSPLYTAKDYFANINNEMIDIGYGVVRSDQGGKYNIYFNNQDEKVEMFRSSVIGILSDIVIEKTIDKFIIYPILKDDLPFETNSKYVKRLVELTKKLEENYDDAIVKEIILEGYKILNL